MIIPTRKTWHLWVIGGAMIVLLICMFLDHLQGVQIMVYRNVR